MTPPHLRAQSHSPVEIKEMVTRKSLDASLNAWLNASLTATWSIVHWAHAARSGQSALQRLRAVKSLRTCRPANLLKFVDAQLVHAP
eukprot:3967361-Pleurochrysis_carterae.AAC.1